LQRARDVETDATLVNSPRQMAKMRISVPGPLDSSFLSLEVLYMGRRQTIAGQMLGDVATANVTVVAPIRNSFELVGSIRNLFNQEFADPASDSHQQDSIPQNGRTMRVGLRWKLWAN
jgi:outer membrane cobalamin receptor